MNNKLKIYKMATLVLTSTVAVMAMVIYSGSRDRTFRQSSAYQLPAYEMSNFPVYEAAVPATSRVKDHQSHASWEVSRKDMQVVFDWYVERLESEGWTLEELYPDSQDVKWIEATKENYQAAVLLENEDGGDGFYINVRVIPDSGSQNLIN